MEGTKRCPRCGQHKDRLSFSRAAARYDGLRSWCKACEGARRQRVHERPCSYCGTVVMMRAVQSVCSRECGRRQQRDARLDVKNPQLVVPWRECRRCLRWFVARGYRRGSVFCSVSCASEASRARGRTDSRGLKRIVPAGGECVYCGGVEKLEPDHVVPLAHGGPHSSMNIVAACHSCNAYKQGWMLDEWLQHMQVKAEKLKDELTLLQRRIPRVRQLIDRRSV